MWGEQLLSFSLLPLIFPFIFLSSSEVGIKTYPATHSFPLWIGGEWEEGMTSSYLPRGLKEESPASFLLSFEILWCDFYFEMHAKNYYYKTASYHQHHPLACILYLIPVFLIVSLSTVFIFFHGFIFKDILKLLLLWIFKYIYFSGVCFWLPHFNLLFFPQKSWNSYKRDFETKTFLCLRWKDAPWFVILLLFCFP